MSLDTNNIEKFIALAKLDKDQEDLETMLSDLNKILDYVDSLHAVEVDDVEPLAHVHESSNVLREDVVNEEFSTEDALLNAPERSGSFIKVPLIIE